MKYDHDLRNERLRLTTAFLESFPNDAMAQEYLRTLVRDRLGSARSDEALQLIERFADPVGLANWEHTWLSLQAYRVGQAYDRVIEAARLVCSDPAAPREIAAEGALWIGMSLKAKGNNAEALRQFEAVVREFAGDDSQGVKAVVAGARQ
jgi:hypothetical protein